MEARIESAPIQNIPSTLHTNKCVVPCHIKVLDVFLESQEFHKDDLTKNQSSINIASQFHHSPKPFIDPKKKVIDWIVFKVHTGLTEPMNYKQQVKTIDFLNNWFKIVYNKRYFSTQNKLKIQQNVADKSLNLVLKVQSCDLLEGVIAVGKTKLHYLLITDIPKKSPPSSDCDLDDSFDSADGLGQQMD